MLKLTNSKLKQQLRLYAVTDNRWTGRQTLMQQIEAALQGGITMLQLREKQMNSLDFLAEAKLVKNLSDIYNGGGVRKGERGERVGRKRPLNRQHNVKKTNTQKKNPH